MSSKYADQKITISKSYNSLKNKIYISQFENNSGEQLIEFHCQR